MDELVRSVRALKAGSVGRAVRSRAAAFRKLGRSGIREIFRELCFCLLTANYTAEGGIRIQEAVGAGFITLSQQRLSSRLRALGYRFPNARARYIVMAREHLRSGALARALHSLSGAALRGWLAENVLGLGYKEASHFLRNIGHADFAIIDFHIIDVLARHGIMRKPKSWSLTRKRYLQIERKLARLARECGVTQGELDFYLWYLETGKVLK